MSTIVYINLIVHIQHSKGTHEGDTYDLPSTIFRKFAFAVDPYSIGLFFEIERTWKSRHDYIVSAYLQA